MCEGERDHSKVKVFLNDEEKPIGTLCWNEDAKLWYSDVHLGRIEENKGLVLKSVLNRLQRTHPEGF